MFLLSLSLYFLSLAVAFEQVQNEIKITNTCLANNREYRLRETFEIPTGSEGCSLNCICFSIKGQPSIRCFQKCPSILVPRGCTPKRGKCNCITGYSCPPEKLCVDKMTGNSYKRGEKWSNQTCQCVCLGGPKGTKKCHCKSKIFQPSQNSGNATDTRKICVPTPANVTCNVCLPKDLSFPNGNVTCTLRKQCEQWVLMIPNRITGANLPYRCTCFGPRNFSKCIPIKKRAKRFASSRTFNDIAESILTEDSF